MVHRFAIISLGILTLATCQSNKIKTENSSVKETVKNIPETKVSTAPAVIPIKKTENVPTPKVKPTTNQPVSQAGIIYLREGENIFLKEQQMNVTFKEILEDSRCPEGTNCIWEGVATAEIEFMGIYTRPVKLKLSTMENETKGYHSTQDFNGYHISLVSISPYPSAAKSMKELKGSYKIALKIAK